MTDIKNADFHEVWWVYAPEHHEWGGLRIARFRRTIDGTSFVVITGEIDQRRIGARIWDDIAPREGWVKVKQIEFPSGTEIERALDAAIRNVVDKIKKEEGFK